MVLKLRLLSITFVIFFFANTCYVGPESNSWVFSDDCTCFENPLRDCSTTYAYDCECSKKECLCKRDVCGCTASVSAGNCNCIKNICDCQEEIICNCGKDNPSENCLCETCECEEGDPGYACLCKKQDEFSENCNCPPGACKCKKNSKSSVCNCNKNVCDCVANLKSGCCGSGACSCIKNIPQAGCKNPDLGNCLAGTCNCKENILIIKYCENSSKKITAEEKASAKVGKDISDAAIKNSLKEGETGWVSYSVSSGFDIKTGQFIVFDSSWKSGKNEWVVYKRTQSGTFWYRFGK